VGFGAALSAELGMLVLLRLPAVRAEFLQHVWRLHERLGIREPFSALSNAVEVTSQTMLFVAVVAIATVAGDVVAREVEDGTLRMAFCRPVSRASVFAQKLIACVSYAAALAVFVGATAMMMALVFEKPGQLVVVSARESVLGVHELAPGLARYAVAIGLLAISMVTVDHGAPRRLDGPHPLHARARQPLHADDPHRVVAPGLQPGDPLAPARAELRRARPLRRRPGRDRVAGVSTPRAHPVVSRVGACVYAPSRSATPARDSRVGALTPPAASRR
jgi:hypothetical protein